MREVESVAPIKKVIVQASSKPWFYPEIISAIQKSDKLYSNYKKELINVSLDVVKKFGLSQIKDVIQQGMTSLNVSIIKFYDFYLFQYIH